MTDERQGETLWRALDRLPSDAGIVFRHYGLDDAERRRLFDRVRGVAGERILLLAGPQMQAALWGADGAHGAGPGHMTASAHDLAEVAAAEQSGAQALFISPVFATPSHPGAATLGIEGLKRLAANTRLPVIALGGMDAARGEAAMAAGAYGWAAIDAWSQ